MQKLSFDPTKDLIPIGMVTVNGMAFTVHPDLPVRSLREFIEYVKARPGQINYSVGGIGTFESSRTGFAVGPRGSQHGRRALSEHATDDYRIGVGHSPDVFW